MPTYYLDSSAVIKRYQSESGSTEVNRIVNEADSLRFISRLSIVEVQRAFGRRLRTRDISDGEYDRLRFGFYADLRRRRLRVKEVSLLHYRSAVRLIQRYAPAHTVPLLRTLDALHLAVALDIPGRDGLDTFVCTDKDLCDVAEAEQLSVLMPNDNES